MVAFHQSIVLHLKGRVRALRLRTWGGGGGGTLGREFGAVQTNVFFILVSDEHEHTRYTVPCFLWYKRHVPSIPYIKKREESIRLNWAESKDAIGI